MAAQLCARTALAVFALAGGVVASEEESCEAARSSQESTGAVLLQGHTPRTAAVKAAQNHDHDGKVLAAPAAPATAKADRRLLQAHAATAVATAGDGSGSQKNVVAVVAAKRGISRSQKNAAAAVAAKKGISKDTLPPHLLELGISTFGDEAVLDYIISNTREEHIVYAGQSVTLRMVLGDGSDSTMREEGGGLYGMDTLPTDGGMINLLDLGGNYGVVSIAAYLRSPNQLRAIAVEPIPSTHFLLRWNMFLNGVPELAVEAFKDPKSTATGVLAINNGISSENWKVTDFCYSPPFTMNAHVCDCMQPHAELTCAPVVGISMEELFGIFNGPLTMLKMDCEGCEESALPALAKALETSPSIVQRLVGELHVPSLELEDIACRFDQGQYFVKICFKGDEEGYVGRPLGCGNPTRGLCD